MRHVRRLHITSLLLCSLIVALMVIAVPLAGAAPRGAERVIVTMRPGASAEVAAVRLSAKGVSRVKTLPAANAVVVEATPAEQRALATDPDVAAVEADVEYAIAVKPSSVSAGGGKNTQVLPWGVDRIDAELVWPLTVASGVRVAVIDTGIDTTHSDLAGNVAGGYSAVSYTASYKDDNGHGTHVAGTVGALNNRVGVVGVSPGTSLLGVKVLDSAGRGWVSDIIAGIDWSIANGARVINMSLGGPTYVAAFQAAIDRANAAGVVVVAAAGNSGVTDNSIQYPGAYNGVTAVGATDRTNVIAPFSTRGPQVDLAAPGVGVNSTYWTSLRGSGYAELNGTSMAAPHVAGAAALVLSTPVAAWDADADGSWDSDEVEARLKATATDLGDPGADSLYGAGLVSAYAATR